MVASCNVSSALSLKLFMVAAAAVYRACTRKFTDLLSLRSVVWDGYFFLFFLPLESRLFLAPDLESPRCSAKRLHAMGAEHFCP